MDRRRCLARADGGLTYPMKIDAPFTLPIYCALCGRAVTLQMAPKPLEHPKNRQAWTCPHCEKKNSGGFPYEIVWVTKGHGADSVA
jgi:hypothetical protein